MVYNKRRFIMKKWTLLLAFLLTIVSLNAQSKKMKIAVMDFRNGVGVNKSEVEGLSDMLINTLYESKRFDIVERSQLTQVLKEQRFQSSELTYEQVAKVGRILGVKSVLVGTVNYIGGEYNVDIRAVNVESAMIVATAGATKSANSTYRETMEKIGRQLIDNLEDIPEPPVIVIPEKPIEPAKPEKPHFRKSGFTLRPEVGLNIPIKGKYYHYGYTHYHPDTYCNYLSYATSPTVELAIGYQAGPHFFFGVIGGYGGKLNGYYDDFYKDAYGNQTYNRVDYSTYSFPIKADLRWYLIDHEYSFIVDLQPGVTFIKTFEDKNDHASGCVEENCRFFDFRLGLGFALGNIEATISGDYEAGSLGELWRLNFNLAYRFGNVIKKWW